MINFILTTFGAAIGKAVAQGIAQYQERAEKERMQAEILEKWLNDIKLEIATEFHKASVPLEHYKLASTAIDAVVVREITSDRI